MALPSLPDIAFTDTDAARVEAEVIQAYEIISGATLYPGDPVRLFLESLAYLIAQQRAVIDYTGKMNLVRLSAGPFLDHLGAFTNTTRLGVSPAKTTLRFSLPGVLAFPVPIPAGTRATPDAALYFATDKLAEIPAGALFVDVAATCTTSGAGGNGLLPGQVNRLADAVQYVAGVINTTVTLGGSDQEGDEKFRERVQLSPERFSTCGPEGAYRYWALTAHQDVTDVAIVNPSPGIVDVYPLLAGGGIPTQDVIQTVGKALLSDKVRPLTDIVRVKPPVEAPYSISLTWYLSEANAGASVQVAEAVTAAVAEFVAWQRAKLGRDVNPTRLSSIIEAAGAKRVSLGTPVFRALKPEEVAIAASVSVTYGGTEAD